MTTVRGDMTDKRRMTVAVTLLITADIESEENTSEVTVKAVTHTMMGSVLPVGEPSPPPTSEAWRESLMTVISKHGAQYFLDELNGEHAEPPPELTQKGADA